jgi:6-pyruvoyltetrahydropterin/6-carboxytetrahydropterin synthase
VAVHVAGEVDARSGWVRDFAELSLAVKPLVERLDHYYLNEIEGLDNPTSEVLARWVFEHLAPRLPGLDEVVVHETCTSGARFRRADLDAPRR